MEERCERGRRAGVGMGEGEGDRGGAGGVLRERR